MGSRDRLILDTHAWFWWISDPQQLSKTGLRAIDGADRIRISVISCWELALAVQRDRIRLDRDVDDWMEVALRAPRSELVGLTLTAAIAATRLPGDIHRDPADRFLVATARELRCPLVTADARLRAYPHVQTIW